MSIVKDALMEEIRDRKDKSVTLYKELNNSQTAIKKKIVGKKLKKNNIVLADLMMRLDKLTNTT